MVVGHGRTAHKHNVCQQQMADSSTDKFAFVRDKDGNIDWAALYFQKGTAETQRMLLAMETNHVAPIRAELQAGRRAEYKSKCDAGDATACNLLGEWNSVMTFTLLAGSGCCV
jgi:desulfoferrodoxin (superoxide reductase-like protein)